MLTQLVAAGPPARGGTPITLGETNVITGDSSGSLDVVIPHDVMIAGDFFETPDIAISGKGRIVGMALIGLDDPRDPYQLYSTRWGFCEEKGCDPEWAHPWTFGPRWDRKKGFSVPAGAYRLYLIADSAPVTITLHLSGLTGQRTLTPPPDKGIRIVQPTNTIPGGTDHVFLAQGPTIELEGPAMLMAGDQMENWLGPHAAADGSCHWRKSGQDTPSDLGPGPHCIAFAERWGGGTGFSVLGGGGSSIGAGRVAKGTWRSSYWAAAAAGMPDVAFLDLWIPFPIN